jgi:DeoR C terminal sensor domain
MLTGGALRKNSFHLVGPLAEDSLRLVSADVLFLAVDGFDVRYGLTTPKRARSARESRHDRKRQDNRCRLRFEQVRQAKPLAHRFCIGRPSRHHLRKAGVRVVVT